MSESAKAGAVLEQKWECGNCGDDFYSLQEALRHVDQKHLNPISSGGDIV